MNTPSRSSGRARGLTVAIAVVVIAVVAVLAVVLKPAQRQASPAPARVAAPPVSASATPSPAGDARPSTRLREVNELLRRRADAVHTGDERAFLATVDPHADATFRAAQRALFHNLRGVPLRVWRYRVDADQTVDPARLGRLAGRADEWWAPKVQLEYALADVDPRPTDRQMGYLFARHGDHWYLSSDTALQSVGVTTWRGPWDFGPCVATKTASGLIISHPDGAATARSISGELDSAVASVTAVWGRGWAQRVAVFVPSGNDELRALVGPDFATDSIAAVAVADYADPSKHEVAGQRVVLNPAGAAKLSAPALSVVLRHEITHVAARADTVDGAPMWLLEGFADYVGYAESGIPLPKAGPDLAAQVRAGQAPVALPSDDEFKATASKIDLAYQQAWSMSLYIAKKYTQPKLVEFYHAVAGAGHVDGARLDALTRSVLGVSTPQLIAGWRHYLTTTFG